MIPTSKVITLINAFKSKNDDAIDNIIKDIITITEKKGQIKLAQDLRKLYSAPHGTQSNGSKNFTTQGHSSYTPGDDKLFERRLSTIGLNDITLNQKNLEIFKEIVDSFGERKTFIEKGIASENKILLHGKPGTGKTLFAYVLAGELNLPILHVHIDSLISSFLGETGKNIRQIFEEVKQGGYVLFLDEFDAIAKKRDDQYELGELKRVVTVLLQNIDDFPPNSILVAATNHPHLLDEAIWRRFDYQINLDVLDLNALEKLIKLYLGNTKNIEIELLAFITQGRSGAVIKQAIHKALRKQILNSDKEIDVNRFLIEELLKINNLKDIDLKSEDNKKHIKLIIEKLRTADSKYYTFKKIEELTGIPDSSLSYYLKQ